MRAVSTPMGTSTGRTALVIVSAPRSSPAPARLEAGINFLLSAPVKKRIRCGTIRPTKPIMPDTDTQTAVMKDAVTRRIILTLPAEMPNELADRSPRDMIFRSRAKNRQIKKPAKTQTQLKETSAQVLEAKLPINQKMMMETCSSAMYLRKLIPADKMAATIIPDSIKLLEDISPLKEERDITATRVPTAPQNAKIGTE